ncbi:MAG: hypothetical protein SCJ97_06705 [Bacillota bacterium]|nr:hypothetical protein [Bacillota bacterium]
MSKKKKIIILVSAVVLVQLGILLYIVLPGFLGDPGLKLSGDADILLLRTTPDEYTPDNLLEEHDMGEFGIYINNLWFNRNHPVYINIENRLDEPVQAVYISARSNGRRLVEAWETRGTTGEALEAVIRTAKNRLTRDEINSIDTLEICLGHSFRERFLDQPDSSHNLTSNIHRGILGLEIVFGDNIVERYAQTYIVASNRSNPRLMELFREKFDLSFDEFSEGARIFTFSGEQVLVKLGDTPRATLMERGNIFVEPAAVTRESVERLARLSGMWLNNNVHEDGRMTYKYWPSAVRESTANNMIRQWMAAVGLIRFGKAENKPEIFTLAEKNIHYNLDNFYIEEEGFGQIIFNDEVKLGAVALAALALLEHPGREKWVEYETALQRTIDSLWNSDGSFTSFYRPEGDMRFQNFYPGEALLYWAALYDKERDPQLLEKFMKSFEFYRDWHLDPDNRNPAFIPWHTQAYYIIWKITGNEELKDFIFEMNDWLLPIQQWPENPLYRDTPGRFYDPNRPFGPPHSSSTGVYLEGLADAFELARGTGEMERMESYRKAINRGLRSVMQLQFVDEVDMFYTSPPMRKYVEGGIRTTVYDNEIRCDNVQHNYLAALKILEVFEDEDFGIY